MGRSRLEKKYKDRIDIVDVDREIRSNGLEFVSSMEELTDAARKGEISAGLMQEKFADAVQLKEAAKR